MRARLGYATTWGRHKMRTIALTLLGASFALGAPAANPASAADMPLILAAVSSDDEGTRTLRYLRRDPMVRRVQELLAELGFYVGPFDGTMDDVTVAAIREYQRRNGLDANGLAGRSLLEHLNAVGQAKNLRDRVDSVKRDKIEAATRALAASPATRALLAGRAPDEAADPTRDPGPCFATPTARCILEEAIESAKGIHRSHFNDWILGEILVVQIKAGMGERALATVRKIDDPRLIMPALRNISRAQSQMGDIEAAKATAELIPDVLYRAEALFTIAAAQALVGEIDAARATAARVRTSLRRVRERGRTVGILADIAVALDRAGAREVAKTAIDAALVTADKIRREEDRRSAFGKIVVALADMDRPEGALMMLDQIPDSVERRPAVVAIAASLARAGDHRRALELARSIDGTRYRALLLAQIALAQGARGDTVGAIETLELARTEIDAIDESLAYPRAYAMSRRAMALVEIGEIDAGLAAANEIGIDRLRAHALWAVAAAQANSGEITEARRTEALSLETVDMIVSLLDRAWLLSNIAISHACAGNTAAALKAFRRALDVAKSIDVAWARAQALGKVAATLVELN